MLVLTHKYCGREYNTKMERTIGWQSKQGNEGPRDGCHCHSGGRKEEGGRVHKMPPAAATLRQKWSECQEGRRDTWQHSNERGKTSSTGRQAGRWTDRPAGEDMSPGQCTQEAVMTDWSPSFGSLLLTDSCLFAPVSPVFLKSCLYICTTICISYYLGETQHHHHRSAAVLHAGFLTVAGQVYWPRILSSSFPNAGFRSANGTSSPQSPGLRQAVVPTLEVILPPAVTFPFHLFQF